MSRHEVACARVRRDEDGLRGCCMTLVPDKPDVPRACDLLPREPGGIFREVKLVAIDLDGTLLNDSKQVSDQTVEALRCLPAQGVRVVIASARPPRSVRHIYARLGLDTW